MLTRGIIVAMGTVLGTAGVLSFRSPVAAQETQRPGTAQAGAAVVVEADESSREAMQRRVAQQELEHLAAVSGLPLLNRDCQRAARVAHGGRPGLPGDRTRARARTTPDSAKCSPPD